jgi:hypothetical protein
LIFSLISSPFADFSFIIQALNILFKAKTKKKGIFKTSWENVSFKAKKDIYGLDQNL